MSKEVDSGGALPPSEPSPCETCRADEPPHADSPRAESNSENESPPTVLPITTKFGAFVDRLLIHRELVRCHNGYAYLVCNEKRNKPTVRVGTVQCDALITKEASRIGLLLRRRDRADINEELRARALQCGRPDSVWLRIAPAPHGQGVIIDVGDEQATRIYIGQGKVVVLPDGCETLFYRTATVEAMTLPAAAGDVELLKKHLNNLHPVQQLLLVAWVTFTLAHAKHPAAKFVVLVLLGLQGSGKTWLVRLIRRIVDPHSVIVQMLPTQIKDLAIALQNAHVVCFDNVRHLPPTLSDALCIAATGGSISSRQLYSDAGQSVLQLHGAVVLNGIHDFLHEPDFAQRCLPLHTTRVRENARRSEAQLLAEFEADLPAIMRGLFELVAQIFLRLPKARVTNPERMIEFVQWLAAMEMVQGVPPGTYQAAYSDLVQQGQRDTLLSQPLAAAVLEFAEQLERSWAGTPSQLLSELNVRATRETQRSRGWPQNSIALSKRLVPLQAALLAQDIRLEFHRGKYRTVTIDRIKHEEY